MGVNTVVYLDHKLNINQLKELDQLLNRTIKSPVGIVQYLNQLGEQCEGYNPNSWAFEVLPDDEHLTEAYTCLNGPEGL